MHYPRISSIVQRKAAEHGIRRRSNPDFLSALGAPRSTRAPARELARGTLSPSARTRTSGEVLIQKVGRYCDGCGSDLSDFGLASYFEPPEDHPVVAFVVKRRSHAPTSTRCSPGTAARTGRFIAAAPL